MSSSLTRFPDWDIRLLDFAQSVLGAPFGWGVTNCAALAARAVDVMTGSALAEGLSARITSSPRAMAQSRKQATRSILTSERFAVVPPNFQQRGDILLAYEEPYECCAVVLGEQALSSSVEKGVFLIPTKLFISTVDHLEIFRCL